MMKAYHAKNGYYPILREIAQELNLSSEGAASRLVEELIGKGYVRKFDRKHRGLSLTEKAL